MSARRAGILVLVSCLCACQADQSQDQRDAPTSEDTVAAIGEDDVTSADGTAGHTTPQDSVEESSVNDPRDDAGNTASNASPNQSEWTTRQMQEERDVRAVAVVAAIRAARHETYDRLVVEFENEVVPGYRAEYLAQEPVECGSGEPISMGGKAVLELRLQPARGYDDQGRSTISHDTRSFSLPGFVEAEISCDFEAVFALALGVSDRLPFRIMELQDPARIVLDVQTARTN